MITETATYLSNDGVSFSLGALPYPLTDFNMETFMANDAVKKTQFPGRWATFSIPEFREIHFAGDIVGTDAADYNTKVKTMKAAIMPPYRVYTGRRHGKLSMTFYGDAATYYAYVIVSSLKTPKTNDFPSVGEFDLTFISFEPYLVNAATGAYVTNI